MKEILNIFTQSKINFQQISQQNNYIKIFSLCILSLYPLFLLLALSFLNPNSSLTFQVLIVTVVVIYVIYALIYLAFNNCFLSGLIITFPLTMLYVVNYYRKIMTGWVFTPGDFSLAGRLNSIMSFGEFNVDNNVIVSVSIIVFSLTTLFFAQQISKHTIFQDLRKKMLAFNVILLIVIFVGFSPSIERAVFRFMEVDYSNFKNSPNIVYQKNGTLLGFYLLTKETQVKKSISEKNYLGKELNEFDLIDTFDEKGFPVSYSDEYMNKFVNNIKQDVLQKEQVSKFGKNNLNQVSISAEENPNIDLTKKPNVVVIMSEAFWDPAEFQGVTFNRDPLENIRKYTAQGKSGKIITPAYGGSTCNPEFEFLTGNSMYFTGTGDIPYEMVEKYIPENDTRSIPAQFKSNGYKTIGLHTYKGEFFNRNVIYPRLGFDQFITEEDMPDAPIKGKFISDEYFTDRIIGQIEEADQQDTPLFLYGISMQNHYEYYQDKFYDIDLTAETDLLTNIQKKYLESYAQGVSDADKQLGRLIEYLKTETDRPTIVFFFGDHLPIIGNNFEIFSSLAYTSSPEMGNWTLEDLGKMYQTPYLLWANYELPENNIKDMSTYFIGANLLELAGLNKNVYTNFMYEMSKEFQGFRWSFYKNDDGKVTWLPIMQDKKWLTDFNVFQYDYANSTDGSGKRYGLEASSEMIERKIE